MYCRSNRSRSALSLVNLVIVIAMVGLLLALLLSAVQKVREAANRVVCSNNLKQIALAMHNFVDSNGRFPTAPGGDDFLGGAGIAYDREDRPLWVISQTAGWAFQIVPYVEAGHLYTTSDIHRGEDGKPDNVFHYPRSDLSKLSATFPAGSYNIDLFAPAGAVRSTAWKPYYCPSRGEARLVRGIGMIDYAACRPDQVPIPKDKDGKIAGDAAGTLLMTNPIGTHGVISARSERVTLAAIKDGTSNTMMVLDKFVRPADYLTGGPGYSLGFAEYGGIDTCRSATTVAGWLPNPSYDTNDIAADQDVQFGSAHPAGVMAAFVDGSVHTIRFGIDPQTFNALANRDDGSRLEKFEDD